MRLSINLFNKICYTVCHASHKIQKKMFTTNISRTALNKWPFIRILCIDTCMHKHTCTHFLSLSFCPSMFSNFNSLVY